MSERKEVCVATCSPKIGLDGAGKLPRGDAISPLALTWPTGRAAKGLVIQRWKEGVFGCAAIAAQQRLDYFVL